MTITKSYSELIKLPTFEERLEYLVLDGDVCVETFGFDRYLNQALYRSNEWKRLRNKIIVRDGGCDLACEGHDIPMRILIHHIDPITKDNIVKRNPKIFDPENLVVVSHSTHNAIHYGYDTMLRAMPIQRLKNDTCPWRK